MIAEAGAGWDKAAPVRSDAVRHSCADPCCSGEMALSPGAWAVGFHRPEFWRAYGRLPVGEEGSKTQGRTAKPGSGAWEPASANVSWKGPDSVDFGITAPLQKQL